jgi:hypothetical protein
VIVTQLVTHPATVNSSYSPMPSPLTAIASASR